MNNEMSTIMRVSAIVDSNDLALLDALLDTARDKVLERLYPCDHSVTKVPQRYESKVIELAVILFNQRGAEGESQHTEGDVHRTYTAEQSLLNTIVPYCGTFFVNGD